MNHRHQHADGDVANRSGDHHGHAHLHTRDVHAGGGGGHVHSHAGHGHGGHSHGHGHAGHSHGVAPDADRRWLSLSLALIVGYMAVEVVVAFAAQSMALLADAAHMLSDAGAIALALWAMRLASRPVRGRYTYGLKRAEILSAQANGLTLLLLSAWLTYESIERLFDPPEVGGTLVLVTALAGVAVNLVAAWCMSKANRSSLNVEGAFQHILTDLYGFIATAVSGAVVMTTGFARADSIASMIVVVLMVRSGVSLVRASGRIFLEAAPADLDPGAVGSGMVGHDGVVEVHDLHIWEITSGQPVLSAHVLVEPGGDCHSVRKKIRGRLREDHGITHATLEVDHAPERIADAAAADQHCEEPHGAVLRKESPVG